MYGYAPSAMRSILDSFLFKSQLTLKENISKEFQKGGWCCGKFVFQFYLEDQTNNRFEQVSADKIPGHYQDFSRSQWRIFRTYWDTSFSEDLGP
jgi:hypothetical protein